MNLSKWLLASCVSQETKPPKDLGQSFQRGSFSFYRAQKHSAYILRLLYFCVQNAVQEAASFTPIFSKSSENFCWIMLEMRPVPWQLNGRKKVLEPSREMLSLLAWKLISTSHRQLLREGWRWSGAFFPNSRPENFYRYPCSQFMTGCASPFPQLRRQSDSLTFLD